MNVVSKPDAPAQSPRLAAPLLGVALGTVAFVMIETLAVHTLGICTASRSNADRDSGPRLFPSAAPTRHKMSFNKAGLIAARYLRSEHQFLGIVGDLGRAATEGRAAAASSCPAAAVPAWLAAPVVPSAI